MSSDDVFIMNTVRSLSSLLVNCRGLCAAARCDFRFHRTGFHCFPTMNTNRNPRPRSPPIQKRSSNNEPNPRLREKRMRKELDGPSTVYLQVIGAGSRDNPASLFVFSEFNRYLFNCGEGTQRLMNEHKLKLSHMDNIFLTRLNWENVGGLSGMILTSRDLGVPEFVLSGPPKLENYLKAIKVFSGHLGDLKLLVRPHTEVYTDNTMTVHQVPLFAELRADGRELSPRSGRRSPRDDAGSPESPGADRCYKRRKPTKDPPLVVSFICKLHSKKGRFLSLKAKELGLPVGTRDIGPLVEALKNERSVTYEGKEIRPEQVCTPATPGPVFVVVQCPSEEFVEAVCTNEQLGRFQSGGTEDPAALFVHMTPESVLKTDEYRKWMERFPSTTEHLILNEHTCTVHNVRSYKLQAQLNMIHPKIFPELKSYSTKEPEAALHIPIVRAECLLKFQLRPVIQWNRDAVVSCNTEEFVKEASKVPNFLEEVDECRKVCFTDAAETPEQVKHPEVVFLGTGSSLPMKTRNVSGTLVNISPSQSILLDCGEGTFGQICRHYGDGVDDALSKISTVFISHIHADHHTGLLMLLFQRQRALTMLGKAFSPVHLVAPDAVMDWLHQYDQHCEEILQHVSFISNKCLLDGASEPMQTQKSLIQALLRENDLNTFQTCLVRHCKNAFACSFTHQNGWKLAFSGDTMPCESFVRIGKNATLLIHEATLEDDLKEEAAEKRHSTTSQAIGVGVKMNAEFIMLNHFSQRYAKIPLFSKDFSDRVGISFDHMRIHFGDFKIIPRLIPALTTLFAKEIDEMAERRDKRELKLQGGSSSAVNSEQETDGGAKRGRAAAAAPHGAELKRLKTY